MIKKNNKLIKTNEDYETVLARIEELFDAQPDTPEGDELELLVTLVEIYEKNKYPIEAPDPISAIKFRMEQQGLKNKDLIPYIGSKSKVSEVLSGKRDLSLNMIRKLNAGLGIPAEVLIKELEEKTGHKVIGNKAASGTEILKELGEEQMRDNSLIVYTSADSVLQIAAHEEVTGLQELYRCCDIAREICNRPEYYVGRIIARPYLGSNASNFKRTPNRHDIAVSPSGTTAMNVLQDNNYMVSCIGKIGDIFNMVGVVKTQKTVSNIDGMNKTIEEAKNHDFEGLCFVNLVEFDSEYGHRRNPEGYGKCIEEFDVKLGELLPFIKENDLLMITADHGNDPTAHGTDHTREKVPLVVYSPSFTKGKCLEERSSFADIGATILKNFNLKKAPNQIGEVIEELLNE